MTDYEKFLSVTGRNLKESAIRRMGTVVAKSQDLVSFAAGYPDARLFPWQAFREIANELLTGADPWVLQYGPTRGFKPLLEATLEVMARRGITADLSELMITSGSQQGLDLVGRVLMSPGDVVLVELPSYTGGISAFKNAGAELVGVKQAGGDGIDLEDLDAVLLRERAAGRRVNLLYLVANFQNPTGLLLGLEKRRRLVEWAERRDVLIIEDDPYGDLYFEDVATEAETRPLRADSADRVIYLSTFSKTLAPGFRVGWMVSPAPLADRFETAKQSMDLTSGILDQRVVHQAIRRGLLESLAPKLRELYRRKRDVMEQALRAQLGDRLTWPAPRGGFFLWAKLPPGHTDQALLARALEQQLVFVIGSAFYVDGTGQDTIRLSFSAPTEERIVEGVRRLAAALEAGGSPAGPGTGR